MNNHGKLNAQRCKQIKKIYVAAKALVKFLVKLQKHISIDVKPSLKF